MGIQVVHHRPTFVALEPADYCMLRCPECPVGQRLEERTRTHKGLMPLSLAQQVIGELAPWAHTVIFHFQGEPLLNPQLPEMIAYAHQRRMFTMLSTNAQLLTPTLAQALATSGLDRIIVSMDGISQSSYAHYRVGGDLERVKAGLRAMSSIPRNRRPEIVLQCLMLRSNEHEWELLRRQYKELGADRLELKTAQFYDYEDGHPDMPSRARYARYIKGTDGHYHIKNPLHNRCLRLWSGCVVTAQAEVRPCCQAKDSSWAYGHICDASLLAVWKSPAAVSFRQRVLSCRAHVSMCGNCPE